MSRSWPLSSALGKEHSNEECLEAKILVVLLYRSGALSNEVMLRLHRDRCKLVSCVSCVQVHRERVLKTIDSVTTVRLGR